MKSTRSRDQAGLATEPATSPSVWSVRRLHNRVHRALLTTFRLRFPEGSLVLTGARRPRWGFSEEVEPNSVLRSGVGKALPSLLSPKINFVWVSSFSLPCKASCSFQGARALSSFLFQRLWSLLWLSLWGPSERASPTDPLASGSPGVNPQCSSGPLLRAPPQGPARASAGDRRLPARMGGVWAPG